MPTFDIKFHDNDDNGISDIFGQCSSTSPLFLNSPVDHPITPPQPTQAVDPAYSGSSQVDILRILILGLLVGRTILPCKRYMLY
jgi:hypothetical protein